MKKKSEACSLFSADETNDSSDRDSGCSGPDANVILNALTKGAR